MVLLSSFKVKNTGLTFYAAVDVDFKYKPKSPPPPIQSLTVLNDTGSDPQGFQSEINCEDCSSLDKLLRVTARVLQFIENLK